MSGSSTTSRSGLPIAWPSFPSRNERFCWSDAPESGPASAPMRRPAARLSMTRVITADGRLLRAEAGDRPLRRLPPDDGRRRHLAEEARAAEGVVLGPPAVRVLDADLGGHEEHGVDPRALEAVRGHAEALGARVVEAGGDGEDGLRPLHRAGRLLHLLRGLPPLLGGDGRVRGVVELQVHGGPALVERGLRERAEGVLGEDPGHGHGVGDEGVESASGRRSDEDTWE